MSIRFVLLFRIADAKMNHHLAAMLFARARVPFIHNTIRPDCPHHPSRVGSRYFAPGLGASLHAGIFSSCLCILCPGICIDYKAASCRRLGHRTPAEGPPCYPLSIRALCSRTTAIPSEKERRNSATERRRRNVDHGPVRALRANGRGGDAHFWTHQQQIGHWLMISFLAWRHAFHGKSSNPAFPGTLN